MQNIKTLVYGFPCGGSSFTFKVIEEFLFQNIPTLKSFHEPEMIEEIKTLWPDWKSLQSTTSLAPFLSRFLEVYEKHDLIKTNYFTRFLSRIPCVADYSIFVIRPPWQWANSALNTPPQRFTPDYFYWHTDLNINLKSDNNKHLIDLWIDICKVILCWAPRVSKKILYINYYDYVDDFKFLERQLNNFYPFPSHTPLKDYTNTQLVTTNNRSSRRETIKDIPVGFNIKYRGEEIADIFRQFNFKNIGIDES